MIASVVFAAVMVTAPAAAGFSHCDLRADGGKRQGTCRALVDGADATISLAPAPAITSGVWRRDAKPQSVWAGTIATSDDPPSAVEVEIYAGGRGVLRTAYGWFAVSGFTTNATSTRATVDASRDLPPSPVDREIIERASRILSSDAAWNRADNRQCPESAATWSIYCAMEKATIEVAGAFHHRRPALQVVREIVDQRTAGRPYRHRLMDYNNDPNTHLADVQSLFAEALRRVGK